jgi:phosphoadenosine phosphosulfate reductase
MDLSSITLQRFREGDFLHNLQELGDLYPGAIAFSTSFGAEDQVITHFLSRSEIPVKIFTLDTGRLFPETYSTWESTLERYGIRIDPYYPDQDALQDWVSLNGPNAFYASVENRKSCCGIRKVEPLRRALRGARIWITGIRAAQSPERKGMPILEWDDAHQLVKYHPLLDWSEEQVWAYIRQHNVPYNPLHDRGFVSIGCAPCTRAIKPGEDFRAGRWWWEDDSKKECGLHVKATG